LKAFDVSGCPATDRAAYGETPFGRGCLAAVRLIEAGVRCVEVTLNGWEYPREKSEGQANQVKILDPPFAALIRDLKRRELLDHTVVLCGGEFGRSPGVNVLDGRDHWPHGFSMLVAGGGLAGGRVIGATDPPDKGGAENPIHVEDLHATIQDQLGIDPTKEIKTPVGRPMALSDGRVLRELRG